MGLLELLGRGPADLPELTYTTYIERKRKERPDGSIYYKNRLIAPPAKALKELQQEFALMLLHPYGDFPWTLGFESAYGSVPRGSPRENAIRHIRNEYFYLVDLADAFPSVGAARLAWVLVGLHSRLTDVEDVQAFLERFCVVPGHGLAQGSAASPVLFNIYCAQEVDEPLRALFERERNITYTRYVDDLTFSSKRPFSPTVLKKIRCIIRDAGFELNHRKVERLRQGTDASIEITGVRLLPGGRLAASKRFLEKLEAALDEHLRAKRVPDQSLRGMIAHFDHIEQTTFFEGERNRQSRRILEKIARLKRPRKSKRPMRTRFTRGQLDDLRSRVPIESVISPLLKQIKPVRGGSEFRGLCPFHNEKTPSFYVAHEKGFFHCFGCGAHGDVFAFVMRWHNLDLVRAVLYVAELAGVTLPKEHFIGRPTADSWRNTASF